MPTLVTCVKRVTRLVFTHLSWSWLPLSSAVIFACCVYLHLYWSVFRLHWRNTLQREVSWIWRPRSHTLMSSQSITFPFTHAYIPTHSHSLAYSHAHQTLTLTNILSFSSSSSLSSFSFSRSPPPSLFFFLPPFLRYTSITFIFFFFFFHSLICSLSVSCVIYLPSKLTTRSLV